MLELVICDDEKVLRNDLRKLIETELDLAGYHYHITEYESGESFLQSGSVKTCDILFLDIEMKAKNGIETARDFRKLNIGSALIFVTSFPDFVFQGYEVSAFNYLLKPYENAKIISVLHGAIDMLNRSEEQFCLIEQRGKTVKIPLGEILYFTSDKRTVIAVTKSNRYSFYEKLGDLEVTLPDSFKRIHSRYLVNLRFVNKIDGNTALCGEDSLPVSRSCKQALSAAFARYLLN